MIEEPFAYIQSSEPIVFDGTGQLVLNKQLSSLINVTAPYAMKNVVVQNWTTIYLMGFRDRVRATWAALRFIWSGRLVDEQGGDLV